MIVGRPEREIERAWLQHDPQRNAIPPEIWRRLRAIKRTFEPSSQKIKAALGDEEMLNSLVKECCCRRGVARQRLLANIRRTFPGAEVRIAHRDVLEISWLTPSPPVIADPKNHNERQDCILANYCVAWPTPPFGIRLASAWSLEVPNHAAARYLQWSGEDFRSALFEAANNFSAADVADVAPHISMGTDIYLPAGGGCFICAVIGARSVGGIKFLYARAATFVEQARLHADQVPLSKAASADRSVAALLLDP